MRPPQFWRAGATLIILLVALCANELLTTAVGVVDHRPGASDTATTVVTGHRRHHPPHLGTLVAKSDSRGTRSPADDVGRGQVAAPRGHYLAPRVTPGTPVWPTGTAPSSTAQLSPRRD